MFMETNHDDLVSRASVEALISSEMKRISDATDLDAIQKLGICLELARLSNELESIPSVPTLEKELEELPKNRRWVFDSKPNGYWIVFTHDFPGRSVDGYGKTLIEAVTNLKNSLKR